MKNPYQDDTIRKAAFWAGSAVCWHYFGADPMTVATGLQNGFEVFSATFSSGAVGIAARAYIDGALTTAAVLGSEVIARGAEAGSTLGSWAMSTGCEMLDYLGAGAEAARSFVASVGHQVGSISSSIAANARTVLEDPGKYAWSAVEFMAAVGGAWEGAKLIGRAWKRCFGQSISETAQTAPEDIPAQAPASPSSEPIKVELTIKPTHYPSAHQQIDRSRLIVEDMIRNAVTRAEAKINAQGDGAEAEDLASGVIWASPALPEAFRTSAAKTIRLLDPAAPYAMPGTITFKHLLKDENPRILTSADLVQAHMKAGGFAPCDDIGPMN